MQDYVALIQNFFDTFAFYEIGIMSALFVVFILFFMLGLLLRGRRFSSKLFFFLSIVLFIGAPFLLQFCMQHLLYKTDVEVLQSKRLEYIDSFFVQANVSNVGFAPFSLCEVSVDILHDGILKFLSPIYPKHHYKQIVPLHLKPSQSQEIQLIFNNFTPKLPFEYTLYIDCHSSNGLHKLFQTPHHQDSQHQNSQAQNPQHTESSEPHADAPAQP
ncbi:DUF2393 family protein [uncultured Helicobacter sp.]|uniref:DUF2393 family protein n=1 Tax=uncultured Helicobacter sp. TaxID=175537 RepID=UPI00374F72A9